MHDSTTVFVRAVLAFVLAFATVWPVQLHAQDEAKVTNRPPSQRGSLTSGQLPWMAYRCSADGLEILIGPVPDGVEGGLHLDARVALQNLEERNMGEWQAAPSGEWRVEEATADWSRAPGRWLKSPRAVGDFVNDFVSAWREDPELVQLGLQNALYHWIVLESDRFPGPPALGQFAVESGRGLACMGEGNSRESTPAQDADVGGTPGSGLLDSTRSLLPADALYELGPGQFVMRLAPWVVRRDGEARLVEEVIVGGNLYVEEGSAHVAQCVDGLDFGAELNGRALFATPGGAFQEDVPSRFNRRRAVRVTLQQGIETRFGEPRVRLASVPLREATELPDDPGSFVWLAATDAATRRGYLRYSGPANLSRPYARDGTTSDVVVEVAFYAVPRTVLVEHRLGEDYGSMYPSDKVRAYREAVCTGPSWVEIEGS